MATANVMKSLWMNVKKYEIIGRGVTKNKEEKQKIYRMILFCKNEVVAKSKFWYYMKQYTKTKKSNGDILSCKEIKEKNTDERKIYAVWLMYSSRTGTHNCYKEYMDVSETGAISQMYSEMTGRHSVPHNKIHIIKIAKIKSEMSTKPAVSQLLDQDLKYPILSKIPIRSSLKNMKAKRPTIFVK